MVRLAAEACSRRRRQSGFGRPIIAVKIRDSMPGTRSQWVERYAGAAGMLLACLCLCSAVRAADATEYEIKAAFIYNLINFTQWPGTVFESQSAPLRVCVVGRDPFGTTLQETLAGERIGPRPISLERPALQAARQCHVIFVSEGTAPPRLPTDAAVLTIGESEMFWRAGGIVNFVVEGGRVRFDVNATAADRKGLRLSANVLRVARRVI